MQMHPYSGSHSLLYSFGLFNAVELNFDWVKFAVHLNDRAFVVVVGECFSVECCAGYYQFQCAFAMINCFLY
jgi:hypothetical protein